MTEHVQIPLEIARKIFDLAVDSPLQGEDGDTFTLEDVRFLRGFAELIGVDPAQATPRECEARFPHPFKARAITYRVPKQKMAVRDGNDWVVRQETDEELAARVRAMEADARTRGCAVGGGYGACGKPEDDPIHITTR